MIIDVLGQLSEPPEDPFYFFGLDNANWFDENFEKYTTFGYIGDRVRFERVLHEKSIVWKLAEKLAPKLKISGLLKAITGFDLGKVATDSGVAKDLFDLLADAKNRQTLAEALSETHERASKAKRYFNCVANARSNKSAVFGTSLQTLDDHLIVVEGQLVHRDVVAQHSPDFASTLRASKASWILCDFPPHALNKNNKKFTGKALLLNEDNGFSEAFAEYLPFAKNIGWYPYVRVTGFFSTSKMTTERLPSMSLSVIEYREPKSHLEVSRSVEDFIRWEFDGGRNRLKNQSDLILLGYLLPIIMLGSNMDPSVVDPTLSKLVTKYLSEVGDDLPIKLQPFYAAVPKPSNV